MGLFALFRKSTILRSLTDNASIALTLIYHLALPLSLALPRSRTPWFPFRSTVCRMNPNLAPSLVHIARRSETQPRNAAVVSE